MQRFKERIVLVTGGSSGIGRETALAFAKEGGRVVVTADRNVDGGLETVRRIRDIGGEGNFIRCDISREEEVKALFDEIIRHYGKLDIAFNNAGIGPDGVRVPITLIDECTLDVFDKIINTNLKGTWLCMKYEIKIMKECGGGVIVNNASVGALKPIKGFGPYAASKAGVILLTKTAAIEGAPYNIRVNVICPGYTLGTMLSENVAKANPEKTDEMVRFIPLGRGADPIEVANVMLWLCSESASFVTGAVIPIDGGLSAT